MNVFCLGKSSVSREFVLNLFEEQNSVKIYFKEIEGFDTNRVQQISFFQIPFICNKNTIFAFFSAYDFLPLLVLKLRRKRIIYCFHDFFLHKGEKNILIQLLIYIFYFLSDNVVVFNLNVEQDIRKSLCYKFFKKEILCLSHGIKTGNNFVKKVDNKEAIKILFFGRIHEYKGLIILLKSLEYVPADKKIFLTICGKGNLSEEEMTIIRKDPRVRLINEWVSEDFVIELLLGHHLMAMPYIGATQSGVMSKSFEFNMPCLITPDPGLVNQGAFGSFIAATNYPIDFAKLIVKLCKKNILIEEKSKHILAQKENYSYSSVCQRLLNLFAS